MIYDKGRALLQGVGDMKRGLCPAVKRAGILLSSATYVVFSKHEAGISKYWMESLDMYPVLYRMMCEVSWPPFGS